MRCDLPSQWNPKEVSGNATLSVHDCMVYGWFYATDSGTITLPSPCRELKGVEIVVVNATAGAETVACTNGFPGDRDSLSISSGQSALLACGPAGGDRYAWAVFGGIST